MEKVKYNREEYRNEYLKSDEWKTLRDSIIGSGCDCQCCLKVKANDVHHMVYRNIVDVTVKDLIPVCRGCHEYIHQAIDDDYITQDPKDFDEIKRKTFNILNDVEYLKFREWLLARHLLSEDDLIGLRGSQPYVIKKISALVRKNIWYDDLPDRKFTGKQILKIRELIKIAKYRRKENLDWVTKPKKEKDVSLKDMDGFKSRKFIKE